MSRSMRRRRSKPPCRRITGSTRRRTTGGASHHTARSREGRGAPEAGHAVDTDGGRSPGGADGGPGRGACPMALRSLQSLGGADGGPGRRACPMALRSPGGADGGPGHREELTEHELEERSGCGSLLPDGHWRRTVASIHVVYV
jgi:hypothetical protein